MNCMYNILGCQRVLPQLSEGFHTRRGWQATVAYTTFLFVLLSALTLAQGVDPCNNGRNSDPLKEPRDYEATCLPEVGHERGNLTCQSDTREDYGARTLQVIQDVNGDGVPDWIAGRYLCDTLVPPLTDHLPQEILLHYGRTATIPGIDNAIRIRAREIASNTLYIASGDFDGDGNIDICAKIEQADDTTFGNTGYDIGYVVVFWGTNGGNFSIDDTTRLECDADIFLYVGNGTSFKVGKRDGLLFNTGAGYSRGLEVVRFARVYMYLLEPGQRWGRNGVTRKPIVRWWNAPNEEFLQPHGTSIPIYQAIDHDGDGIEDVVMTSNSEISVTSPVWTAVLYGRPNALPDTNEYEVAVLDSAAGLDSYYSDITGDGIPELIVLKGQIQQAWVYLGIRGQRLHEQYGSGKDSGSAIRNWGRPWTMVRLAGEIGGFNWYRGSHLRLWDLGDGDGDGVSDIWVDNGSYILCYGTGDHLDDYADAVALISGYLRTGQHLRDPYTGTTLQIVGTTNYLYFFHST